MFILLLVLASLLPAFLLEPNVDNITELMIAYLVLFGSIGLVLAILLAVRYEIGENDLIVKLGPISYIRIPVSEITKLERSYNPLSSPASSLKRLLVTSKSRSVLISPANEKEFVRILTSRNSTISVQIDDSDNSWWKFWNWDI